MNMKKPAYHKRWPALEPFIEISVLILFLCLAALFMMATPLQEASDEAHHVGFTLYLKHTGQLPNAKTGGIGWSQQEATQAPLYYYCGAGLIRNKCTTNAAAYYVRQPNSPIGRADLPGSRHMYQPPDPRQRDMDDTYMAIYLLRIYSSILILASILLVRLTIKRIFPEVHYAPVVGMVWVGFNPMVLFIGTSVCNDNLVIMMVSLTLLIATFECAPSIRALLLGICSSLAILSKASALILLPILPVFIFFTTKERKAALRNTLFFVIIVVIGCGWWFVRNRLLYGEYLATTTHIHLAGNARPAPDALALFKEWSGFVKSFWGVFGAFNIVYTDTEYYIFYILTLFILAGSLWYVVQKRGHVHPLIYLAYGLLITNVLAVAQWTSRLWGSAGRLMFPSLSAIAILGVTAWAALPRKMRMPAAIVLSGWLIAMCFRAAIFLIPPAYTP
ncbi:MAG: hypothetical protein JRJ48_08195 [Deltaproteobacteria bacterium]|nr:hypothetical protein [Deltaproteobacteria bacterium]